VTFQKIIPRMCVVDTHGYDKAGRRPRARARASRPPRTLDEWLNRTRVRLSAEAGRGFYAST
jgi:hypothetical protein